MRIYQDELGWRIGNQNGRMSQVFTTRKDAQKWLARMRATREAHKKFWENVPSVGEILAHQYKIANIKPLRVPVAPRIRFLTNGDVSIRLRRGDHTYDNLVVLDLRLVSGGFGWFIEQVLMEDEYQTEPAYFPTLRETITDVINYIRASTETEWKNCIPLIEKFMKENHHD